MKSLHTFGALALGTALALGAAGAGISVAYADNDETTMKSEQPVTDTWITTKVKAELATTDGVKSTDIDVSTKNGVVSLIGVLTSEAAVDKAVAAAESIKGVRRVDSSGLKVK
jgi:hyperosmotically inducible protein